MKNEKIIALNTGHLTQLIEKEIALHGSHCDLNNIDVSKITNMSSLFQGSTFNGDISQSNVSKVAEIDWMFSGSQFISNVVCINEAFVSSKFSGDISEWRLINVDNIEDMFQHCKVSIPY